MKEPTKNYTPSDTTKMFDDLNKILYILGMRNFWVEDVKLPKKFVKVYDALYSTMYVLNWIFNSMQFGAIFTQKKLTENQYSEIVVLGIGQPVVHLFCLNCIYYRKKCRQVLYYLAIVVKEVYNDKETEQNMIRKFKLFLIIYSLSVMANWINFGLMALIAVVRTDAIFAPIITAWPDIEDTSTVASCARIGFYIYWCISMYRFSAMFLIVLMLFISLSHQYKNMYRYFESLNCIFEDTQLSHKEMEIKFEEALMKGIQSHSDTVWCAQQAQIICNEISSIVVLAITVVMPVMLNCNNYDQLAVTVIVMAFFMWNAGDITVEAQKLPDAIYGSGWYNCHGKNSARIRNLVVVAMAQAQKPVVFTAFGVVQLSYETFVSIIKTVYSLMSVFYS